MHLTARQSQRRLAAELGIALGLVNAYLRRCVRKGLLKVNEVPERRYMYYLTPQGFAEKSRLTVEYLSVSFGFFRRAKAECGVLFNTTAERGFLRVALAGISDLAEIAMICALDTGVQVDRHRRRRTRPSKNSWACRSQLLSMQSPASATPY